MRDVKPDPKRRRRHVETPGWWKKQQRRKTGKCVLCRRTRKTSWHHLVPRSQGGGDVEENLVELCGDGTTGCHGDIEARRRGARHHLRSKLTVAQTAYIIGRTNRDWIERHYPTEEPQ